MSFIDSCTDEDIESLQTKNMLLQCLAEKYNAMLEVALERSVDVGYEFLKAEAKRRISLGIIQHSYMPDKAPDVDELDG